MRQSLKASVDDEAGQDDVPKSSRGRGRGKGRGRGGGRGGRQGRPKASSRESSSTEKKKKQSTSPGDKHIPPVDVPNCVAPEQPDQNIANPPKRRRAGNKQHTCKTGQSGEVPGVMADKQNQAQECQQGEKPTLKPSKRKAADNQAVAENTGSDQQAGKPKKVARKRKACDSEDLSARKRCLEQSKNSPLHTMTNLEVRQGDCVWILAPSRPGTCCADSRFPPEVRLGRPQRPNR